MIWLLKCVKSVVKNLLQPLGVIIVGRVARYVYCVAINNKLA